MKDGIVGMTFERPTAWVPWEPNRHDPAENGPFLYLSNVPLTPACAVRPDATPNPPDAMGLACPWPLVVDRLPSDGVLVEWFSTRILEPRPTAGTPITINGGIGRVSTEKPGCGPIGGDEAISVWVPMPRTSATLSNVAVEACLRGPALAQGEAQVMKMLGSSEMP